MSKFTTYPIGSPYKKISTATAGSAVSTIGIQLLNSLLIPANTFTTDDIITVEGGVSKSNTLGTMTLYLYWNTSASLSGAIQIGVSSAFASGARYVIIFRRMNIRSSTNNTIVAPSAVALNQDPNSVAGTMSTLVINWTNAGYLILAADHTSASESVTGEWLRVGNY